MMLPIALRAIPRAAKLLVATAAVLLAFLAGAVVNGWRLEARHTQAIAIERERYETLQATVREQNRAVEHAKRETETAKQVAIEAKKLADERKPAIKARIEKVAQYAAKDCEDALAHWWGAR